MTDRGPLVTRVDPELREQRIAGALFLATCASVFVVYLARWQTGPLLEDRGSGSLVRAVVFTATLMTILLAHEAGHWLVARQHGIRLALPWFIPAPVLVGTFGAIIRWSDAPRTRAGLLEMGAAGPLGGLIVVVVVVVAWLVRGPVPVQAGELALSRPLLWWILGYLVTGAAPPAISTQDPLGFAGWIGALVTAMNLLPTGQLDGAHVFSALLPGRARNVGRAVTVVLLIAGLFWPGWAVWAALAALIGHSEGATRDARDPGHRPRCVAAAAVVAFILCFTPVPFR